MKTSEIAKTMANYTAVSMGAILRDYIEPKYLNDKHKMLCDIADCLYNTGLGTEYLSPEYKKLYDEYGKEFWEFVLKDMGAIDSQLEHWNVKDLVADYNDMLVEHGAL